MKHSRQQTQRLAPWLPGANTSCTATASGFPRLRSRCFRVNDTEAVGRPLALYHPATVVGDAVGQPKHAATLSFLSVLRRRFRRRCRSRRPRGRRCGCSRFGRFHCQRRLCRRRRRRHRRRRCRRRDRRSGRPPFLLLRESGSGGGGGGGAGGGRRGGFGGCGLGGFGQLGRGSLGAPDLCTSSPPHAREREKSEKRAGMQEGRSLDDAERLR